MMVATKSSFLLGGREEGKKLNFIIKVGLLSQPIIHKKFRCWQEQLLLNFYVCAVFLSNLLDSQTAFVGEMSESRAKRVRIKEVDGWTLRMLIDYIYTAEIQVTEENVQVRVRTFSATREM